VAGPDVQRCHRALLVVLRQGYRGGRVQVPDVAGAAVSTLTPRGRRAAAGTSGGVRGPPAEPRQRRRPRPAARASPAPGPARPRPAWLPARRPAPRERRPAPPRPAAPAPRAAAARGR